MCILLPWEYQLCCQFRHPGENIFETPVSKGFCLMSQLLYPSFTSKQLYTIFILEVNIAYLKFFFLSPFFLIYQAFTKKVRNGTKIESLLSR